MNENEIVDLITKKVMDALSNPTEKPSKKTDAKEHNKKRVLILGKKDCKYTEQVKRKLKDYTCLFYKDIDYKEEIKSFEKIVIPYLSVNNMGRISMGIYANSFEEAIIHCIKNNIKINAFFTEISEIEQSCNKKFLSAVKNNLTKLQDYNIDFAEELISLEDNKENIAINKKLVSERDLLHINPNSVVEVCKSTIFTPSAKDIIRDKKIIIKTI